MPYSSVFSEATPDGDIVLGSGIDDEIRQLKVQLRERLQSVLGMNLVDDPQLISKVVMAATMNFRNPTDTETFAAFVSRQPVVTPTNLGDISSNFSIDLDVTGPIVRLRLTGSPNLIAITNVRPGGRLELYVESDATVGRTLTVTAPNVRWLNNIQPAGTLTSGDRLAIYTFLPRFDGSVLYGSLSGIGWPAQ